VRSRNGNRSLSFSIYALVFFTTLLSADMYHIGYQAVVKNAILVNETLNISKAMTPCHGNAQSEFTLENPDHHRIESLIHENNDKFYHYLLAQSLHVKHRESLINQHSSSLTTLTFPTECFKVTFKGNLAKIALIK
jgi:hypothetical protein